MTITFDGPPDQPPASSYSITEYEENGMLFSPILPAVSIGRTVSGIPAFPDNGTAYLQADGAESLRFNFIDDSFFTLISVDLAGYSTIAPDAVVQFTGYLQDNSTVTTTFSVNGIEFQTFYFGPAFSNLIRVEIPTDSWSLDNLVVMQIPEPGMSVFLIAGGFLFWMGQRRR